MDIKLYDYGILSENDLCCYCKNCIPLCSSILSVHQRVTCKKHLITNNGRYLKYVVNDLQYNVLWCKKFKPIIDDYGDIVSCKDYYIFYNSKFKICKIEIK